MNARCWAALAALALVSSVFACSATVDPVPGTGTPPANDSKADGGTGKGENENENETKTDAGKKPSSGGTVCEQICEKGASAECSGQSTCVEDCEADLEKVPAGCKEQADAANECAIERGSAWKCSSKGRPQVGAGCEDEADALIQCVLGGGGGGGGNGSCGTLSSGDPTCDTCVEQKCCAIQAACSDDNECRAILTCFNSCSNDACFTQCEEDHPSGVAKEQALYGCITGPKCGTACD